MTSTRSLALEEVAGGEDRQTRAKAVRARKARTLIVMGAIAGLLISGLAFVAYNIHDAYSSSNIKSEYESAYDAYVTSVSQLDESIVSISTTLNECRSSVADEQVCADLEQLNGKALELSNQRLDKQDIHDKTTREIRQEIGLLQDEQTIVDETREALLAALEPVAKSQIDKIKVSLNEAIANAEGVIAQAQKIVDSTKDEVKDPATRDVVLDAIQKVRAQIESVGAVTGTDTAPYTAALNLLNQAVEDLRGKANAVVYSHDLWEKERREAEAEASASAEAEKREKEDQDKKDDKDKRENRGSSERRGD